MFVLGVNDFRKIFYIRVHVWHHLKIKSNWKYFQFDRKYSLPTRKIIFVLILPSNDFRNYSLLTNSSHTRTNLISAPTHAPTSSPYIVWRQAPTAQPSQARQAPARFALRSHPRITPIALRSHQDCTDLSLSQSSAAVLCWYWSISHSLFLLLSIWPDLMNFFWLGFVSFVFNYWEIVLYICLEAEKMWETSKKCVFYIIFRNTTEH